MQLDRMSTNLLFQMGCILNCSSQDCCVGLELSAVWKLEHSFQLNDSLCELLPVPTSIPGDSLVQIPWKVIYHSRGYHRWTAWERSRNKNRTQQMSTSMDIYSSIRSTRFGFLIIRLKGVTKLLGAWNLSGINTRKRLFHSVHSHFLLC